MTKNVEMTPALASAMAAIAQASLDKEAKKAWDSLDVPIEHAGRAITLPGEPGQMPLEKAVEALQRRIDSDKQMVNVVEMIDAYPQDAMVAFIKAMQRLYGWTQPVATPSFFGPKPPTMLSVKTGPGKDDFVQVPFGSFMVPGVSKRLSTGVQGNSKGQPNFYIAGEFPMRERAIIVELANEARRIVREHSIYRAKAVRLNVALDNLGKPVVDWQNAPEFLDVRDTTESSLVFDAEVQDSIDTNILTPIRHTEACRAAKIPLKRGVLLEGPYGTGKTLLARMTAATCERHGWTFILMDKVQGLQQALEFAQRYAPAVVFAEDVDRVADKRDEACNDLVNTMDGIATKTADIMVILTTNHSEKLDPVILRPGRLDAVISLKAPGAAAAARLVQHYAAGLLPESADLVAVGEAVAGFIPASIREAVERAKLSMIRRGAKTLDAADLVVAAHTMREHMALLERRAQAKPPTNAEVLEGALRSAVLNGRGEKVDLLPDLSKQVQDLCDHLI